MAEIELHTDYHNAPENPLSTSSASNRVTNLVKDFEEMSSNRQCNHSSEDEYDDDSLVLCVSGSRLVRSGFKKIDCTENISRFINAGGEAISEVGDSSIDIMPDYGFDGGDVLKTNESIINGGDFASFYQSARVGNLCYQFENLLTGEYIVDLHFAEIVNTSGPKGMRVFDVLVQEEKVVSDLDIYAIVGANRPLQIVGVRVAVGESGRILIRFDGVHGTPIISGICIKEAPKLPGDLNKLAHVEQECPVCHSNTTQMEVNTAQIKQLRMKSTSKYEKKIEELNSQFQLKTDECYQAWMSLSALNKELENVQMELHNKSFQNHCLDQAMVSQAAKLRDVSNKYERDKDSWAAAVDKLERKIKIMKQEHTQLSREARDCANSLPDLEKIVSAVQGLVAQCEDLKLKYSEEHVKRKKLYNQIQESRGNIRVFCRCRPLSKEEVSSGCATVVDFDAAKEGDLGIHTGSSTKKIYKFDRVYTPRDNQVDVFADASPMVVSVLDGYNVCIFAYGQTGTGKTFTMEGTEQNRGVNYRTLEHLYKVVEERKETFVYHISVSVLEVYNEQIRDLLATSPSSKKLEVRQASEGVHHVPGIVEAKVENVKEVWNVLQAGSNTRAVGSNNINEHSSRSHCMICIMVRGKNMMNGECTKSKLWLVDLAGSERLAKTDIQGERLKEAQNINRSLSALGDVISALATKNSHIPYRNSKLTHLLQDSLGGDSKTLMFAQISPSELDLAETVSSLNFATRVRGIELGPAKKQIDFGELQKLKVLLDKAKQESKLKDEALRKLEENYQNLEGQSTNKDQLFRDQQEKVTQLEVQLESRTKLCEHLEKQLLQQSDQLKTREETCKTLKHKVSELENKLKEHELVESKILQRKVKDLESKLKERTQVFELQAVTFQEKIKELENKLESQQEHTGSLLIQQKIEELEEKLRKRDPTVHSTPSCPSEKLKATPNERKARSSVLTSETPNRRLRIHSNSSTHPPSSQGSVLLSDLRRKQDLQNKGIENNNKFLLSAPSSVEKKKVLLPTDLSATRHHLDPSKAFARVTRKPFPSAAERPLVKINRDQQQVMGVVKERDNNTTRVWSR